MNEKIYTFYEPHETGGDCEVTITESKIVKYMIDKGYKQRIQNKYPYMIVTDEVLIDDFCAVHWAVKRKVK